MSKTAVGGRWKMNVTREAGRGAEAQETDIGS